jgi:hypothetical protein
MEVVVPAQIVDAVGSLVIVGGVTIAIEVVTEVADEQVPVI